MSHFRTRKRNDDSRFALTCRPAKGQNLGRRSRPVERSRKRRRAGQGRSGIKPQKKCGSTLAPAWKLPLFKLTPWHAFQMNLGNGQRPLFPISLPVRQTDNIRAQQPPSQGRAWQCPATRGSTAGLVVCDADGKLPRRPATSPDPHTTRSCIAYAMVRPFTESGVKLKLPAAYFPTKESSATFVPSEIVRVPPVPIALE